MQYLANVPQSWQEGTILLGGKLVWSSYPASAWHLTLYCQPGVSLCLLGHLGSVDVYVTAP